jgi:hypothetical protein
MDLAARRTPVRGAIALEFALQTTVIDWVTPAASVNFTTFVAFAQPNLARPVPSVARARIAVWYNPFRNSSSIRSDWGQAWKIWKG